MEKFLIITKWGIRECEAEDFEDAVQQAYNNHTRYDDVFAIVRADESEE